MVATGFTTAGFVAMGLLIGLVVGLIWGVTRERKGMNKKYIFWGK